MAIRQNRQNDFFRSLRNVKSEIVDLEGDLTLCYAASMRWPNQYLEGACRLYTANTELTVIVGSSVWLGLAIGQTALAFYRDDGFGLVLGLVNILISASTVSRDILVLLYILRQLPPALRHD